MLLADLEVVDDTELMLTGHRATLLQQLFIEIDDLRRAADCQDAMVKMSAICCGKDFCLNQRWKDLVIHTMMLPRRSWISSLAAVEV